ncbi:hypothetical protein JCM6882_000385 [Rhodosporidiobolus microsporus]
MDNAGFELYCDCVYADWLIQSGLCREIRFWFVSDVMRRDFDWLLNSMVYGHLFPDAKEEELASLKAMGQRWKDYVKQGKWVYEEHPFWITGPRPVPPPLRVGPHLNHRKLTYDCHAPPSTPFAHAIGPLATEADTLSPAAAPSRLSKSSPSSSSCSSSPPSSSTTSSSAATTLSFHSSSAEGTELAALKKPLKALERRMLELERKVGEAHLGAGEGRW